MAKPAAAPNIVIVLTDQQRADMTRREGYPLDTTPFLDRLARHGTWFNRAYTAMPACSPARVSLLTGRYPSATRVRTNWNIADACFERDLFDLFRAHGYVTALCGKNHSHLTPDKADDWYECGHLGIVADDRTPEEEAFDAFLQGTHFHMAAEPTPFPVECQIPHRLVNHAERWISSVEEQPFLLWLSFPEPHNPYQVPEPYYSMFPPETLPPPCGSEADLEALGPPFSWCRRSFERAFPDYAGSIPRARSNYLGMLRLLDDEIARFVAFLERRGLRENTLIVFLSDHGDFVGDYGLLRKGPRLPEALTRIPLLFSGPGVRAAGEPHQAHVSICDILPTLCEVAGIPLPNGIQGRSLWPLLSGECYPVEEFSSSYAEQGFGGLPYTGEEPLEPREDGLIDSQHGRPGSFDCLNSWTQSGAVRMIRHGDWKLVMDNMGHGQLFHLASDPGELVNLFDQPKLLAMRAELLHELVTWMLRVQDPLPLPRHRYVMKTSPHNYWSRSISYSEDMRRPGESGR